MPTFHYKAMDNCGVEIYDTVDASNESEALTLIREIGFFVTRISDAELDSATTAGWAS